MPLSIFDASVPVYAATLNNLTHVLKKGQANAKERDVADEVFLSYRHAPEMLPLYRQVHLASDFAKGGAARLAGVEVPSWDDKEETFADLLARIEKTRAYVSSFKEADFDGAETREITLSVRDMEMAFTGHAYLLYFNLPNFYFHVTTTYSLLRAQGVPLGKMDFFGRT